MQDAASFRFFYWHPPGKSWGLDTIDRGTSGISFISSHCSATLTAGLPAPAPHNMGGKEKEAKKSCFVFRDGVLPREMGVLVPALYDKLVPRHGHVVADRYGGRCDARGEKEKKSWAWHGTRQSAGQACQLRDVW
jgi:hypothetical protein